VHHAYSRPRQIHSPWQESQTILCVAQHAPDNMSNHATGVLRPSRAGQAGAIMRSPRFRRRGGACAVPLTALRSTFKRTRKPTNGAVATACTDAARPAPGRCSRMGRPGGARRRSNPDPAGSARTTGTTATTSRWSERRPMVPTRCTDRAVSRCRQAPTRRGADFLIIPCVKILVAHHDHGAITALLQVRQHPSHEIRQFCGARRRNGRVHQGRNESLVQQF
jgi:hypothetical protein